MRVFYDVSARVVEFGSTRFYEHIREHVSEILTECQLEVSGDLVDNLYHLYQRYATAYIIGSTSRDVNKFIEYLVEEYDEGDEESYAHESDRSAQILRQSGYLLDARFPDLVVDELPKVSFTNTVFPGCDGEFSEHEKAINYATQLFIREHTTRGMEMLRDVSRTGLASVIASVFPGTYVEHYGDDFKGLVVVCEHETLF